MKDHIESLRGIEELLRIMSANTELDCYKSLEILANHLEGVIDEIEEITE